MKQFLYGCEIGRPAVKAMERTRAAVTSTVWTKTRQQRNPEVLLTLLRKGHLIDPFHAVAFQTVMGLRRLFGKWPADLYDRAAALWPHCHHADRAHMGGPVRNLAYLLKDMQLEWVDFDTVRLRSRWQCIGRKDMAGVHDEAGINVFATTCLWRGGLNRRAAVEKFCPGVWDRRQRPVTRSSGITMCPAWLRDEWDRLAQQQPAVVPWEVAAHHVRKAPQGILVWTDGSTIHSGIPDLVRSGLGIFFEEGSPLNFFTALAGELQTNNRAELLAVVLAAEHGVSWHQPIVVHSDSWWVVERAQMLSDRVMVTMLRMRWLRKGLPYIAMLSGMLTCNSLASSYGIRCGFKCVWSAFFLPVLIKKSNCRSQFRITCKLYEAGDNFSKGCCRRWMATLLVAIATHAKHPQLVGMRTRRMQLKALPPLMIWSVGEPSSER
ncbi:rnh1 [Symbiodinium pilosum]|uniref:Rnh1 protein n=1 Tax=Symbiodinium pilosum TaxID=2952 RepID=A0A812QZN2_SYMPI|nr:rnh1 [Symbiodinium pilosum]